MNPNKQWAIQTEQDECHDQQRQDAVKTHQRASQTGLGVEGGFLEVASGLGPEDFISTTS